MIKCLGVVQACTQAVTAQNVAQHDMGVWRKRIVKQGTESVCTVFYRVHIFQKKI